MHLVDFVLNLDREAQTHAPTHGAEAILHFFDDTLQLRFL